MVRAASLSSETTDDALDPFIVTLCRLSAPGAIRPPKSPQLQAFSFFTSRSRHSDGNEQRHFHMGYFPTKEVAERWAVLMRQTYPNATAMRAPPALLRLRDQRAPALAPPDSQGDFLTDTQVIRVLETRRDAPSATGVGDEPGAGISLLKPDDTNTRRVLKEAIVRGAPVSFSVQLRVSEQALDPASLPPLSIFRAYTLYAVKTEKDGRTWHSLRLGFFSDAISAKQVAYYVRSSYSSVAVVPISEEERAHAGERRIDPATLCGRQEEPDVLKKRIDDALEADRPIQRGPVAVLARQPAVASVPVGAAPARSSTSASSSPPAVRGDSLEQTLEMLATSELFTGEDSLSETGVRHLAVRVEKKR
jgi:hypothetical protein